MPESESCDECWHLDGPLITCQLCHGRFCGDCSRACDYCDDAFCIECYRETSLGGCHVVVA